MASSLIGGPSGAFFAKQNTASQVVLSVTATASTTNGAFGSWGQATASSAADYYVTGLSAVQTAGNAVAASHIVVAVGYGGSGSETTLGVLTLAGAGAAFDGGQAGFEAPPRIAAGQRIAVRVAVDPTAPTPAAQLYVFLWLVPFSSVEGN
jgi:hypothetical protein